MGTWFYYPLLLCRRSPAEEPPQQRREDGIMPLVPPDSDETVVEMATMNSGRTNRCKPTLTVDSGVTLG